MIFNNERLLLLFIIIMILKYLLIFSILFITTQQCEPLYWEVNSTYVLDGKELNHIVDMGV